MAVFLAVIIWALALMTGYFCFNRNYWMPEAISEAAHRVDGGILLTMAVTGVAFFLAQGLLGYCVLRFRDRGDGRARYIHGNNLVEVGGMVLTAVVFVALAIRGQGVWASVHLTQSPAHAFRVEITGEQFIWNVRYPGPDGRLGRTEPRYYEKIGNTVGIVPDDPAGADDIITLNNLAVPVNTPVELTLRSKDVLHDFYLPNLRIKQDAVPGLAIPLRFTATKVGDYPVACAELCGHSHYNMRATLKVMEPDALQAWLREMAAE